MSVRSFRKDLVQEYRLGRKRKLLREALQRVVHYTIGLLPDVDFEISREFYDDPMRLHISVFVGEREKQKLEEETGEEMPSLEKTFEE